MAASTDHVVAAFARLCTHPFAGLSDAVRSVLTALERQLPAGRVIFGELNYDTGEYRVLDARGEGLSVLAEGARLPLGESFCVHMANDNAPALIGDASRDPVYAGLALRKVGRIESYVAAPVELRDGTRVATVCAMSSVRDSYGESELGLITIAARLVAYEWECVGRERQLRRLAQQQRALTGDPLTGLPGREAFLDQLEREWLLAQRGITESYLLTLKPLGIEDARRRSGDAVADLLLQSTSEVISAAVRRSDITGRLAHDVFGVILVGCAGVQGVEACALRVEGALHRQLSHRPEKVELTCGVESVGDADSAVTALERAEAALSADLVAQETPR